LPQSIPGTRRYIEQNSFVGGDTFPRVLSMMILSPHQIITNGDLKGCKLLNFRDTIGRLAELVKKNNIPQISLFTDTL
jgi:hypothetical protein